MTEASAEVVAAQEGVRDVLAALVREYDSHSGAFEGLDYVSPWAFVTPAWARRAACTTADLQRMITELRVHTATGRPVPADVLDIEERFRRAAKEWTIDTGYVRPPVSNRFVLDRFPNRDAIKRHVARRWKAIPFSDSHARGDPGNIDLFGLLFDRFGHRVSTSVALKLRYSGLIRGYISFPYYKEFALKNIWKPWITGIPKGFEVSENAGSRTRPHPFPVFLRCSHPALCLARTISSAIAWTRSST